MYITPDSEIKNYLELIEKDEELTGASIKGFSIYGICRFFIEMQLRISYFETFNKPHLQQYKEAADLHLPKKKNSGLIQKLSNRISSKITRNREETQKKNFYDQYDKQFSGVTGDFLFVATSSWMDKNKFSLELFDIIKYFKQTKRRVDFVLPNFTENALRRTEYDKLFLIDINKGYILSDLEKKTIEKFADGIIEKINFLKEENFVGIETHIKNQLSWSEQLKKIVDVVKPKYIIARSLYSDKWVPMSCKDSNTKTIEVQHGVFTKDNLYYYCSDQKLEDKLFLPNAVLCLGKSWLNLLRSQSKNWNEKNSAVLGVDTNEMNVITKSNTGKVNVLIAFQDTATEILDFREDMMEFFDKNKKDLTDFDFVLRYHPANGIGSIQKFISQYPSLHVSDPQKESSYEALANAEIIITASSMIIYEALNFGKKVISFERFRKLTIEEGVYFTKDASELMDVMIEANKNRTTVKPEYLSELNFSFLEAIA